jgi:gliding motility-associated-like protein
MKKTIFLSCFLVLCANLSAQISIPTGPSNVIVPYGTNNYTATVTTGNGGTGVEWFSDYLCTNSIGTNATYNGATANSTMIYAKSTNGGAYSNDPKQVYIFKPQNLTASYITANSCSGVNVTIVVDSILDSLTTIVLEDATIDPNVPSVNYDNNFLMLRPEGNCAGKVHFLTKYDLSVIPSDVIPLKSQSSIMAYSGYAHGGDGNVYEQFVPDDMWSETTVTNTTAPMPITPNVLTDNIGSWFVSYGAPSLIVAHADAATMGTTNEGDKLAANTNLLLNQQVIIERAGDQMLSMYHFSPDYDSRYYSKNYKTNASLLPQLKTVFFYNYAPSCSYSWTGPNGFTSTTKDISNLMQSGLYVLTITSAFGYIVVINVNIVVPPGLVPANSIDVKSACKNFTWIDNINYVADNNTATYTIFGGAANGCDSIITLNLTIEGAVYGIDVRSACNSYTWINGVNYATNNNTATYNIVGGSADGCDSIVTLNLKILPGITVNLGEDIYSCDENVLISPKLNYASYLWNNGTNNFFLIVSKYGTYSLTATDTNGCSASDEIKLIRKCPPFVWFPNVFTPNGDSKNDTFRVVADPLTSFSLKVFNRWGKLLFETNNTGNGWDGKYLGNEVPPGTYFYTVKYSYNVDSNIINKDNKGSVSLLR